MQDLQLQQAFIQQEQQLSFTKKLANKKQQLIRPPFSEQLYSFDPKLSSPIISAGCLEPDSHILLLSSKIHKRRNLFLRLYQLGEDTRLTGSHMISLEELVAPGDVVELVDKLLTIQHTSPLNMHNSLPIVEIQSHSVSTRCKIDLMRKNLNNFNSLDRESEEGGEETRSSYIIRLNLCQRSSYVRALHVHVQVTFVYESSKSNQSK